MRKPVLLLAATAVIGLAGLTAYARLTTSAIMVGAARAFVDSLSDEQKAKAVFKFDPADDERSFWNYIPTEDVLKTHKRPRRGVGLVEMSAPQKHLAHALLATGLSQRGYIKAVNIMSLDDILRIMENDTSGRRNSDKYFWSIFGTPSDTGTWGFRVEGHHLSVHFTIVNGRVVSSPTFLGTNPHEVKQGPRNGLRVLAAEEDLARELLGSLTPEQKKTAVVAEKAPADMLTKADRKAVLTGQPAGLSAAKMNAKQRSLLHALLEEYAHNLPEDGAAYRLKQIKDAGTNLNFAWAGSEEKGQGHYYRVQAGAFLVEYDNTQNNANHIHSVWRDFKGDFAEDLLAQHYKAGH